MADIDENKNWKVAETYFFKGPESGRHKGWKDADTYFCRDGKWPKLLYTYHTGTAKFPTNYLRGQTSSAFKLHVGHFPALKNSMSATFQPYANYVGIFLA